VLTWATSGGRRRPPDDGNPRHPAADGAGAPDVHGVWPGRGGRRPLSAPRRPAPAAGRVLLPRRHGAPPDGRPPAGRSRPETGRGFTRTCSPGHSPRFRRLSSVFATLNLPANATPEPVRARLGSVPTDMAGLERRLRPPDAHLMASYFGAGLSVYSTPIRVRADDRQSYNPMGGGQSARA
jgi:hypothetical protein